MILNSFDNILLDKEHVDVPEFGEGAQILVQEMSGARLNNYITHVNAKPDFGALYLVIACAVNEEGEYIAEFDQADEVNDKLPPSVVSRIVKACNRVNKLGTGDIEEKKSH